MLAPDAASRDNRCCVMRCRSTGGNCSLIQETKRAEVLHQIPIFVRVTATGRPRGVREAHAERSLKTRRGCSCERGMEGALTVFVVFGWYLRPLPMPEHIGQQDIPLSNSRRIDQKLG